MAGKGISGSSYPEIFFQLSGITTSIFTQYLIKLSDVIKIVKQNNMSGTLVLNCGGGDQLRLVNPKIGRFLPNHWNFPAHMEAPINFSTLPSKRFKQRIVLFIKFLIKKILKSTGFYANSTPIQEYEKLLEEFVKLSHSQALRIIWIDTAIGDYKVPKFIRIEKSNYCKKLVLKYVPSFYPGSSFLSFEGLIEPVDLLDDAFHLNNQGHRKLGYYLATVAIS